MLLTIKPLHPDDNFHRNFKRFQDWAIKRDGTVIGKMKWTYRPKSAGGEAWEATLEREGCAGVSFYHKDRAKLLADVRNRLEGKPFQYCV